MRDSTFHAPPSRRSVITASIILLVLYAVLMVGGALSTRHGVMPTGDPAGQDFSNFYAASRLVRGGRAAEAYDLVAFNRAIVADHPGATATYFWAYPPPSSLLVAPLAYMPYGLAMTVWTVLGLSAFLFMAWRLYPVWSQTIGRLWSVRVDGLRQAGHGIGKSCGATELFNQAPSPHNGTDPQQSVYLELTVG